MDDEAAKAFLAGTNAPTLTPGPYSNLPGPERIGPEPVPDRGSQARVEADYIRRNMQDSVPLDTETGAPSWDRFMLSFRRQRDAQVGYLKQRYGDENVRMGDDGNLIIRVLDPETGKPKDIVADERKISAKDLIDLSGAIPEVAGAILGVAGAKRIPAIGKLQGLLGVARDAAAGAVAGETAGAIKDIAVQPNAEILPERAKMAGIDFGLGMGTYMIPRFWNFVKSPLNASRGQVQFDALAAQKYFKDKYGVDVPLTVGESTGSPLFSRTEAFIEKLPGGSTPIKALKEESENALRSIQDRMMGTGSAQTDESVGQRAIDAIRKQVEPLEQGVESSRQQLATGAQGGIENMVSGLTQPQRELYRESLGNDIRAAVTAKRDAAKAQADNLYEAVRNLPGGQGPAFDGGDLQRSFKDILSKLPSPEVTTQVPTGILGPTGAPIMRTQTGETLLKEFVPPNVLARLQSVSALKNPTFSLSDLQQMRREVYDDIANGEGVPGLGTHYLADIGKSLTEAIDTGVSSLPTSDLKTALQKANEFYKTQVVPFNRQGVTELFRQADESGMQSGYSIVSKILSGDNAVRNWGLMKETLGPASVEYGRLRRAVADSILENSRLPGDQTIDAKSLIRNLYQFRKDFREISDDVFGPKINELFHQARFLDVAQGAKVSADDLQALLKSKNASASDLSALLKAESARDAAYSDSIVKAVASKDASALQDINPSEFVNRFLEKADPKSVQNVMGMISKTPGLVDDVRAKVIEKVFRDAARKATPSDIGSLMSGDPTRIVSGTSVFQQIENPVTRRKLESVLGPDIFNDLKQYIKLEAAGEFKEQSFQAAGGLSAGMQIANMTKHGPLKYLTQATKDWVAAKMLTSAPLRAWLQRLPSGEPSTALMVLSSPQFLTAVSKEFGEGGLNLADQIRASTQKYIANTGRQSDFQSGNKNVPYLKSWLSEGVSTNALH